MTERAIQPDHGHKEGEGLELVSVVGSDQVQLKLELSVEAFEVLKQRWLPVSALRLHYNESRDVWELHIREPTLAVPRIDVRPE